MKILGIETSCDETAASIVEDGRWVVSNTVVSSLKEHSRYGGVIPEIASRRQLECINAVVTRSLEESRLKLKDVDALAVTATPGLIGSLLVGIPFCRALGFALKIPVIEVNHIQAHLYANFLSPKGTKVDQPKLPAIGLVVSGGHTSLYLTKNPKHFELIGQTRDDAAGEAFDKVARILDLGYPGGPIIDRLARQGKKSRIRFTCAPLPDTLDFSYSGIKTAVLHYKNQNEDKPDFSKANIAYAFSQSIVDNLVEKCLSACHKFHPQSLLIGGGVAANSLLREKLSQACQDENIRVYFPPLALCLDNAAMIAGLAYHYVKPS